MRALRIFSLVIGAAIVAVAQSSTPAPPSDKAQWLERANLITASIQEDAKDLAPSLRLILLGKLGEVWRNVDPQRSKAWLSDSLTAITSPPEQESAEDRKTRMQVAYNLLPDLNESDQAAADQLLDYLVADAKQKIAANARGPGFTSEVMALGNALRAVISNPDQ